LGNPFGIWEIFNETALLQEKRDTGLQHAEPRDIRRRDHDDQEHDQDLVPAFLAYPQERVVVLRRILIRTETAGLQWFRVRRVIVVLKSFVMGHITAR